jgi:hypothetical protein
VVTAEEVEAALSSGYELRGFELKGPGPRTDAHLFAKVTRAALSMGNLRDGGHVIIGIDDLDPRAMLPGLEAVDLASWLAYDDLARKLAEYVDPPLRFDLASVNLPTGVTVAVIQVSEFLDIPHLCAKDYPKVLRKGALYALRAAPKGAGNVGGCLAGRDEGRPPTRDRKGASRPHRNGRARRTHSGYLDPETADALR